MYAHLVINLNYATAMKEKAREMGGPENLASPNEFWSVSFEKFMDTSFLSSEIRLLKSIANSIWDS